MLLISDRAFVKSKLTEEERSRASKERLDAMSLLSSLVAASGQTELEPEPSEATARSLAVVASKDWATRQTIHNSGLSCTRSVIFNGLGSVSSFSV